MAECSEATSNANIPRRSTDKAYLEVEVLSWKNENGTIFIETFTDQQTKGIFRIPWRDEFNVWPFCPSTLLKDGAHRSPTPSSPELAAGVLYLDEDFINASRATTTGFKMKGGGTKWPINLPVFEEFFTRVVPVRAHHLVLTGNEQSDQGQGPPPGVVDLMVRTLAPAQELQIANGPMQVELTKDGCKALGAKEAEAATRVVPVVVQSLLLTGIEAVQEGEDGEPSDVDLMDDMFAPAQTLKIADGSMDVKLTRDGCHHFGVEFPDALHFLDAIRVIQENRDSRQVSIAQKIVAECLAVIDAGNWEEVRQAWGVTVKTADAKKLIDDVSRR